MPTPEIIQYLKDLADVFLDKRAGEDSGAHWEYSVFTFPEMERYADEIGEENLAKAMKQLNKDILQYLEADVNQDQSQTFHKIKRSAADLQVLINRCNHLANEIERYQKEGDKFVFQLFGFSDEVISKVKTELPRSTQRDSKRQSQIESDSKSEAESLTESVSESQSTRDEENPTYKAWKKDLERLRRYVKAYEAVQNEKMQKIIKENLKPGSKIYRKEKKYLHKIEELMKKVSDKNTQSSIHSLKSSEKKIKEKKWNERALQIIELENYQQKRYELHKEAQSILNAYNASDKKWTKAMADRMEAYIYNVLQLKQSQSKLGRLLKYDVEGEGKWLEIERYKEKISSIQTELKISKEKAERNLAEAANKLQKRVDALKGELNALKIDGIEKHPKLIRYFEDYKKKLADKLAGIDPKEKFNQDKLVEQARGYGAALDELAMQFEQVKVAFKEASLALDRIQALRQNILQNEYRLKTDAMPTFLHQDYVLSQLDKMEDKISHMMVQRSFNFGEMYIELEKVQRQAEAMTLLASLNSALGKEIVSIQGRLSRLEEDTAYQEKNPQTYQETVKVLRDYIDSLKVKQIQLAKWAAEGAKKKDLSALLPSLKSMREEVTERLFKNALTTLNMLEKDMTDPERRKKISLASSFSIYFQSDHLSPDYLLLFEQSQSDLVRSRLPEFKAILPRVNDEIERLGLHASQEDIRKILRKPRDTRASMPKPEEADAFVSRTDYVKELAEKTFNDSLAELTNILATAKKSAQVVDQEYLLVLSHFEGRFKKVDGAVSLEAKQELLSDFRDELINSLSKFLIKHFTEISNKNPADLTKSDADFYKQFVKDKSLKPEYQAFLAVTSEDKIVQQLNKLITSVTAKFDIKETYEKRRSTMYHTSPKTEDKKEKPTQKPPDGPHKGITS